MVILKSLCTQMATEGPRNLRTPDSLPLRCHHKPARGHLAPRGALYSSLRWAPDVLAFILLCAPMALESA